MSKPVTAGDDYVSVRQLVKDDVVNLFLIQFPIPLQSLPFPPHPPQRRRYLRQRRRFVNTVYSTSMVGTSKFTLPKDWSVVEVPRKHGNTVDKYYHDPETGQQFRSLKEVERYITEGATPAKRRTKRLNFHNHEENSGSQDMTVSSGKMLDFEEEKDDQYQLANVSPTSISPTSPFKLPDGWVVEEIPRRSGGYIDKYYYEPGTGQKFRSRLAVEKHLSELEENSPLSVVLEELRENNLPLSKAFKLSNRIKNHGSYNSWKKSVCKKEETSSSVNPPSKINWVIADNGGDTWDAFVDDTLVPDSMKQQWSKTFMSAINNGKHNAPVSG